MSAHDYDWAQAVVQLFECKSKNIKELVAAANLDPMAGDLRGADFSDLDLSGFDLSGWDLWDAIFIGANVQNTNFSSTKVGLFSLLEARNWDKALYSKETRDRIEMLARLKKPINELEKLEVWIEKRLRETNIELLGDLVQMRPKEILKIPGIGKYSLNQVRYSLAMHNLSLGTRVKDWPPYRMRAIFSCYYPPESLLAQPLADDPRLVADPE